MSSCFPPSHLCPRSFPYSHARQIFGYPVMVLATVAIGLLGMSVWACSHAFTVGMRVGATHFSASPQWQWRAYRNQDFQLGGNDVGRQDPI